MDGGFLNYRKNNKFNPYKFYKHCYTEKLDLNVRERKEGLSKLDFGDSYLMIEDNGVLSTSEKNRSQNPMVIRIEVDYFEETVKELEQRKVKVEVHTFNWGIIGVIIDPEGNRIEKKY
ncbi:VOC family protein [Paenibacillus ginsengarvi]|uniref:Glyoxalase/bleomycin resistance/dioxygenase family protein n=1 Tax=Paenibacillus ginsengarvi TaxID=400777 RepID=A0A3B0AUP3_9BACL|nr:VOC family protein [Paenibacillus ginsengarvi]RKN62997.1 glyoxalase/bleomycin resistance/dioxygenase family protein [Paenibacillus ginsengarvi]